MQRITLFHYQILLCIQDLYVNVATTMVVNAKINIMSLPNLLCLSGYVIWISVNAKIHIMSLQICCVCQDMLYGFSMISMDLLSLFYLKKLSISSLVFIIDFSIHTASIFQSKCISTPQVV